MKKLILPTIDQIYGSQKISIFSKYGTRSTISDFSILKDGFVSNNFYVNGGYSLISRTGMWYTQTIKDDNNVHVVDHRGYKTSISNLKRQCGIRPVLLCDEIVEEMHFRALEPDLVEFQYGEYPFIIADERTSRKMELLYHLDLLEKTGKIYVTDTSRSSVDSNAIFMATDYDEYFFEGNKYIRLETLDSYCNVNILSDGQNIHSQGIYWVKVKPIVWIMDLKTDFTISKDILLAGIQFNNYNKTNSCFSDSDIYAYLNNIMINNIEPSLVRQKCLVRK